MKKSPKYFFLIISIFCLNAIFYSQNRIIDSLKKTLEIHTQNDSEKVNLLYNIGRQYNSYTATEHISNYITAYNLAKQINFKNGVDKVANTLIRDSYYKEMYDISLSYCLDYIDYLDQHNDSSKKQTVYLLLGNLMVKQGKASEGIYYQHLAKHYYFTKNDNYNYARSLNSIVTTQIEIKQYDSALLYCNKSLLLFKHSNKYSEMANSTLALAEINLSKFNYNEAKLKAQQSLNIYTTINLEHGICNSDYVLGLVYLKLLKPDSALFYLNQSLEIATKLKLITQQKDCFKAISDTYLLTENYKQSYQNYVLYKFYFDSISVQNIQSKMNSKEIQIDISKKNNLLKNQEYRINIKTKQTTFLILVLTSILFLLLILIIAYKKIKKSKNEILKQKKLIEEKQIEILDSIRYAKRIQQSLLPTEKFIGRIFKNKI